MWCVFFPLPLVPFESQVWISSGVRDVFTWHLARNPELDASLGRTERSGPVDHHLRGREQICWPNPRNHPLFSASESTKWGNLWSCWWQAGVQTLPCRCPTLITVMNCFVQIPKIASHENHHFLTQTPHYLAWLPFPTPVSILRWRTLLLLCPSRSSSWGTGLRSFKGKQAGPLCIT